MSQINQMEEKLSLEQLASKIKSLINRSPLSMILIGELLIEYKGDIEYGGVKEFYRNIEMSDRTAQHYMQIASNKEIQKLKAEGKVEGLDMSAILEFIGMYVNVSDLNNDNTPQQQEYVPLGSNFDFNTCRSTKIFKEEYKALATKVSDLEAELNSRRSITA
jgi:hypothetical protein